MHVPKTGGTTIRELLKRDVKHMPEWHLVEFIANHAESYGLSPAQAWELGSPVWRRILTHAGAAARPHLIVEQHIGTPGLGGPFMQSVLANMSCALRRKGCRLLLATTLREPVSRMASGIFFHHLKHNKVENYIEHNQDVLLNFLWSTEQSWYKSWSWQSQKWAGDSLDSRLNSTPGAPEQGDLGEGLVALAHARVQARVKSMLRYFELVGTTDELEGFARLLYQTLGWQWRGMLKTNPSAHPYELTPAELARIAQQNERDTQFYQTTVANRGAFGDAAARAPDDRRRELNAAEAADRGEAVAPSGEPGDGGAAMGFVWRLHHPENPTGGMRAGAAQRGDDVAPAARATHLCHAHGLPIPPAQLACDAAGHGLHPSKGGGFQDW
jgi:hypothetical protein